MSVFLHSLVLSFLFTEQALGASQHYPVYWGDETQKNYRRGDRTSTEIRIISLLHAKIGGGDSHAEMKQERLAAQRSCFMF